jgi:hypothetical protein
MRQAAFAIQDEFIAVIRDNPPPTCLKCCAGWRREAITKPHAHWNAFDFDAATWTAPASREKTRREHRVSTPI